MVSPAASTMSLSWHSVHTTVTGTPSKGDRVPATVTPRLHVGTTCAEGQHVPLLSKSRFAYALHPPPNPEILGKHQSNIQTLICKEQRYQPSRSLQKYNPSLQGRIGGYFGKTWVKPTTGLRKRPNDTSRSTGRRSQQKAATRCNMRREERVPVQGPVKKQQPDGMSHRGSKVCG